MAANYLKQNSRAGVGVKAACLLTFAVTLGACSASTPTVSGNTIDRWNRLDKILPEAPLVNVSYRYDLVADGNIQSDLLGGGKSWTYVGNEVGTPESQVIVTLVDGPEKRDIGPGSVVTVGRQQFNTVSYCLSGKQTDEWAVASSYRRVLNAAGFDTSGDHYLQIFASELPDELGRFVDIAYVESLQGNEQACDGNGGFKTTGGGTNSLSGALRDRAEQSFDVVG